MRMHHATRILVLPMALVVLAAAPSICIAQTTALLNAMLTEAQEVPPTGSSAIGIATGSYDDATQRLALQVLASDPLNVADLSGAFPFHIHAAPVDVNGGIIPALGMNTDWEDLPGPPVGPGGISFIYNEIISSAAIGTPDGLNPDNANQFLGGPCDPAAPDLNGCIGLFEDALLNDGAYLNLHTNANPSGDIRGQIQLPEPSAGVLAATSLLTLAGLAGLRRQ